MESYEYLVNYTSGLGFEDSGHEEASCAPLWLNILSEHCLELHNSMVYDSSEGKVTTCSFDDNE